MELNGSHLLTANIATVWKLLLNPDILAKITPGISELILETDQHYKAIAEVKIGPVKGRFEGTADLLDINEPHSFKLKVFQASKIGDVDATVQMNLKAVSDTQTELSFDGEADISGLLARTGNRVMSGVANSLSKQFFENFEEYIKNNK
jgi:uncharacterized protein